MIAIRFWAVSFVLLADGFVSTAGEDLNDELDKKTKPETVTMKGDSPSGLNPNTHVELDKKCRLLMEQGSGSKPMMRFFFDAVDNVCRQFVYNGDGGNENNFQTELDCLNDCYTGVSEGVPVSEEDVVFIGRTSDPDDSGPMKAPVAVTDCKLPKDPGNCTGAIQSFYFLPEWQSCVAFVYSGCGGNANRFESRVKCEQSCLVEDGSVCRGPTEASEPLRLGVDCASTDCPSKSICVMGAHGPECCNRDEHATLMLANAPKCENGARAGGHVGDYFVATFAFDCVDLICAVGERCRVAPASGFAKCCKETGGQPQKPLKTIKPTIRVVDEMRG